MASSQEKRWTGSCPSQKCTCSLFHFAWFVWFVFSFRVWFSLLSELRWSHFSSADFLTVCILFAHLLWTPVVPMDWIISTFILPFYFHGLTSIWKTNIKPEANQHFGLDAFIVLTTQLDKWNIDNSGSVAFWLKTFGGGVTWDGAEQWWPQCWNLYISASQYPTMWLLRVMTTKKYQETLRRQKMMKVSVCYFWCSIFRIDPWWPPPKNSHTLEKKKRKTTHLCSTRIWPIFCFLCDSGSASDAEQRSESDLPESRPTENMRPMFPGIAGITRCIRCAAVKSWICCDLGW